MPTAFIRPCLGKRTGAARLEGGRRVSGRRRWSAGVERPTGASAQRSDDCKVGSWYDVLPFRCSVLTRATQMSAWRDTVEALGWRQSREFPFTHMSDRSAFIMHISMQYYIA